MDLLHFKPDELSVTFRGEKVILLPKEYALLEFLYSHKNQTLTREQLLNGVWFMEEPGDRTVDDHIYRVRKKIAPWAGLLVIDTVRGKGYRLRQRGAASGIPENPELSADLVKLWQRYHLMGQGQAINLLAENRDVLGVKLDPVDSLYLKFMRGEFTWLVEAAHIPFWERAFYLLHIYYSIQFDTEKTLVFFQRALKRNLMPSHHQQEMAINIINLYIETGRFELAESELAEAFKWVEQDSEAGWLLFLHLKQAALSFISGHAEETRQVIEHLETLTDKFPYQREGGLFHIVKGLWLTQEGKAPEAAASIDSGLEILRESGFVPHYIVGVRVLVFVWKKFNLYFKGMERYLDLWEKLSQKYAFLDLSLKIEKQLNNCL